MNQRNALTSSCCDIWQIIRPKLFYWKFKPVRFNSILHLVVTRCGGHLSIWEWQTVSANVGLSWSYAMVQIQACILGKQTGNVAMQYTKHQTIFAAVYWSFIDWPVSHVATDGRSVSQSILVSSPTTIYVWGSIMWCCTVLERGGHRGTMSLSFVSSEKSLSAVHIYSCCYVYSLHMYIAIKNSEQYTVHIWPHSIQVSTPDHVLFLLSFCYKSSWVI